MFEYLKYRIFRPIMATLKYEKMFNEVENSAKKLSYILNSPELKKYQELEKYIALNKNLPKEPKSNQFNNEVDYKLKLNEYNNFMAQYNSNVSEYERLKKDLDIDNLDKLQKFCGKHAAENKWECTFDENFDTIALDNKWFTKPAAGEFVGKTYSQEDDLQLTTDGDNLNLHNSLLTILTQKEQAQGLRWNHQFGFVPSTFNYTSGIANTSKSFRQIGGKFLAKIHAPKTDGVCHAFWMAADTMLPHINVFCVNNGKIQVGAYGENGQNFVKTVPMPYKDDFYIVGIEWDNNEIRWTVNNRTVYTCNIALNRPLYVAFSSGVKAEGGVGAPVSFDIDWVKCYRRIA